LKKAGAAEGHDGIGKELEDSSRPDAEVDALAGVAPLRPVDVGRCLGRDVNRGIGAAADVETASVAVDEAVPELLDEHERHLGQVLVEVDRPVDVQRRLLVVMLDSGRSSASCK
jgi:hypothetical protein